MNVLLLAWDTKPEAHQGDVRTSRTDTQNVFLCRGLRSLARHRGGARRLQDAELVAVRVGENVPRPAVLHDGPVGEQGCTEAEDPADFCG
jgi:hypothetical protein